MQNAETVLSVLRERGERGLPCDELYRQLFNPQLYLLAYGRIYANKGSMTRGASTETVDGMSLDKIRNIIDAMRHERYRFTPVRRVYVVRRAAPRRIPCTAGRNLEGGFWVCRLTRCRKVDGTRACRMAVAWWRHRRGARSDPRDMAKAGLLEVQPPLGEYPHPPERCLKPVPCHALAWDIGRRNLHGTGDAQGGHSRR